MRFALITGQQPGGFLETLLLSSDTKAVGAEYKRLVTAEGEGHEILQLWDSHAGITKTKKFGSQSPVAKTPPVESAPSGSAEESAAEESPESTESTPPSGNPVAVVPVAETGVDSPATGDSAPSPSPSGDLAPPPLVIDEEKPAEPKRSSKR